MDNIFYQYLIDPIVNNISYAIDYIKSSSDISDILLGICFGGPLILFVSKIQRDSDRDYQIYLDNLKELGLNRTDETYGVLERTIIPGRFRSLENFLETGDISALENEIVELKPIWKKGFEGIHEKLNKGEIDKAQAFNKKPALIFLTNSEDMYLSFDYTQRY